MQRMACMYILPIEKIKKRNCFYFYDDVISRRFVQICYSGGRIL